MNKQFIVFSLCLLGLISICQAVALKSSNVVRVERNIALTESGCNCNGTQCDCCDVVPPPVATTLCLDSIWNAKEESITVKVIFGGAAIDTITFTEQDPSQCVSIFGGSLCITAANLSIVDTGACGCWDIKASFFGFAFDFQIGCWEYGHGAKCPGVSCDQHDTCLDCDALISCGWCAGTSECMSGDENGPFSGTCPSNWQYHKAQCTTM